MSTKLEQAPVEAPAERAAHMSKLARLQRWTRGMGYAACAWALFFTLEHVYWLCGGSWLQSEADMRSASSAFAQNPWSYVIQSVLLSALFAILALFPLALTWQGKHLKLGVGVALVRPRTQSVERWLVLVATWIFGAGMTIYGCWWIVTAVLNMHAASFLQGLLQGGMNWTIEGILFVTVAALATYSERFARQTMTSQPA
jgi:hypothetical protein